MASSQNSRSPSLNFSDFDALNADVTKTCEEIESLYSEIEAIVAARELKDATTTSSRPSQAHGAIFSRSGSPVNKGSESPTKTPDSPTSTAKPAR